MHPLALRRILAFAIDWLIIALWAGVLFGLVVTIYSGIPTGPAGPWQGQVLGFIAMTLPVVLYFALSEASAGQASLGKRVMKLCVSGKNDQRASRAQTLLRNAIKFTPWELGHSVANHAAFSTAVPVWVYAPLMLSLAGAVWWFAAVILRGQTPYDVLSATHVELFKP